MGQTKKVTRVKPVLGEPRMFYPAKAEPWLLDAYRELPSYSKETKSPEEIERAVRNHLLGLRQRGVPPEGALKTALKKFMSM